MMHETKTTGAASLLRPISLEYDAFGHADASVLFSQGNTKVLVSVTLANGVPSFLKGQKTGWLTAEYAMLPCATGQRTNRETSQANRNHRSIEISRLIGRCLRTTVDLTALGERSITIDCDVLHADGSTRVACITAASIALKLAAARWHINRQLPINVVTSQIVALSAGIVDGKAVLDLSFAQDSHAQADFNFVLTTVGDIVEIQGTAERSSVSWDQFEQLKDLALQGCAQMVHQLDDLQHPDMVRLTTAPSQGTSSSQQKSVQRAQDKTPFFSLGQRLQTGGR